MKFTGKIVNGTFTPSEHLKDAYGLYLNKIEGAFQNIQIEFSRVSHKSEAQLKLFHMVIVHVANLTGHTHHEIVESIRHLRILNDELEYKEFADYNTRELTSFIDQAIAYFNEFFELNVTIVNEENKPAKITNEFKQD